MNTVITDTDGVCDRGKVRGSDTGRVFNDGCDDGSSGACGDDDGGCCGDDEHHQT
jgi:hypothetical protein